MINWFDRDDGAHIIEIPLFPTSYAYEFVLVVKQRYTR